MAKYMKIGLDIGSGISYFYLETAKWAWQDPTIPKTVKDQLDINDKLSATLSDLKAARDSGRKDRIAFALPGREKEVLERRFTDLEDELSALHKLAVSVCLFSTGVHSSVLTTENFTLIHETEKHHPAEYLPTSDILIARENYNLGLGKRSGTFVVKGRKTAWQI